jgi:hypothetical protein
MLRGRVPDFLESNHPALARAPEGEEAGFDGDHPWLAPSLDKRRFRTANPLFQKMMIVRNQDEGKTIGGIFLEHPSR